jgi:hypothetical protein
LKGQINDMADTADAALFRGKHDLKDIS